MRGEGRHCDLHLTEDNSGLPGMTERVGAALVLVGKGLSEQVESLKAICPGTCLLLQCLPLLS